MKRISFIGLFAIHLLCAGLLMGADKAILSGLTLGETKMNLTGRLVFLYGEYNPKLERNDAASGIYEIELREGKLKRVAAAPDGLFIHSLDGNTFCSLYGVDRKSYSVGTNIFIYVRDLDQSKTIQIPKAPLNTVAIGRHVFFQMKGTNRTFLQEFDFDSGAMRVIEMTKASTWEYHKFVNIHASKQDTNVLHFEYASYGDKLTNDTEYKDGYYALDVLTGKMQWLAADDDEVFDYKAFDGRYVWFEGKDAPIHGFRLVASPTTDSKAPYSDPKGKETKTLTRFSRLAALTGGMYWLEQLSPCRHYAFVRFSESIAATKSGRPGWVHTYYVVDVTSGKCKVLIQDEHVKKTPSMISTMKWVP